ncbi:hypothetical protein [Kribbella sp. NPDC006257]|uniref:hypothetical protein n=1 Tax=Kribbella sp. NPDC006257 TaxID=3156738 RepID=UPI0033A55E59
MARLPKLIPVRPSPYRVPGATFAAPGARSSDAGPSATYVVPAAWLSDADAGATYAGPAARLSDADAGATCGVRGSATWRPRWRGIRGLR